MKLLWLMFRLFCVLEFGVVSGNFHYGDYVQMARRSQFNYQRTSWHDLQGRHCPRFEQDSVVSIPIPKPKLFNEVDEYKIQLAFDHERLLSSWLTILAKPDSPGAGFAIFHEHKLTDDVLIPYVKVSLWKREDELLRVQVHSARLPETYMSIHPGLVEEYKNRSHWPKHVLVKYEWESYDDVDAERGLLVLLYGGLLTIAIIMSGIVFTSKKSFERFFKETVSGGPSTSSPSFKADDKGE